MPWYQLGIKPWCVAAPFQLCRTDYVLTRDNRICLANASSDRLRRIADFVLLPHGERTEMQLIPRERPADAVGWGEAVPHWVGFA